MTERCARLLLWASVETWQESGLTQLCHIFLYSSVYFILSSVSGAGLKGALSFIPNFF